MKRIIFVLLWACGYAWSSPFDGNPPECQDYVISRLVEAVKRKVTILVAHDRWDESYRWSERENGNEIPARYTRALDLRVVRHTETLKSSGGYTNAQPLYIYHLQYEAPPAFTRIPKAPPPPYKPEFVDDDCVKLFFLRQHTIPMPTRFWHGSNDSHAETVIQDLKTLDGKQFLQKHGLSAVFSRRVFEILEAGLFRVDYPVKHALPETDSMRLNSHLFEMGKVRIPDIQKLAGLIHLSYQEVSEIVYLAYLEEDKGGGAAKYAEAVRQSRILQPMPKAEFKTLIGQKLHAALSDPEYGTAEKRAQEEKERKQRELAERKAKLRAEINIRMDAIKKAEQVTAEDFIQFDAVFVQFAILPPEEGKRASWDLEHTDIRLRQLKLLLQNDHENLSQKLWHHAHDAWTRIIVTLKDAHIQVNYVEQYDDILRKVQGLPLDPEQVKELEEAVAEMEANRKKYAR